MVSRLGTAVAIIVFLSTIFAVSCSSDEDSDISSTPPAYFQYKVKALNTALYYILQALHDDLMAGLEVDISFLNRINVIIMKIKSFYGRVDETNALMLGELLKVFPGYLVNTMDQAGLNFTDYTATPTTDSLDTENTSDNSDSTDSAVSGDSYDSTESADSAEDPDSADSVDSGDNND